MTERAALSMQAAPEQGALAAPGPAMRQALAEAARGAGRWPYGLYVHVPYCVEKCPYCDFNSYALPGRRAAAEMVDALLREAEAWARLARRAAGGFRTVFVGGGTPTVLGASDLARLLRGLREHLPLSDVVEFTVEANPGTLTPEKVGQFVSAGVNRVSLGAQSFIADELRLLGRIHSVGQIHRSLKLLREAGLVRLNLDLMFGLPGQSLADWERSLEAAIATGVPHISAYGLTLEEGTPFHRLWEQGRLPLPSEGLQADMYRLAVDRLKRAGLARYEVSNFARPGYRCRHNLNYWVGGEYLGIGPGAHSHWLGYRFGTLAVPARYADAARQFQAAGSHDPERLVATVAFVERLDRRQRMDEWLMLQLRLSRGLDRLAFFGEFGCWPEQAYRAEAWAQMARLGLLRRRGRYWRLTARGFLVADAVVRHVAAAAIAGPAEADRSEPAAGFPGPPPTASTRARG